MYLEANYTDEQRKKKNGIFKVSSVVQSTAD